MLSINQNQPLYTIDDIIEPFTQKYQLNYYEEFYIDEFFLDFIVGISQTLGQ